MSDSDNDNNDLPHSVFSFQNQNTTLYAKGPNINHTTNLSFRNTTASRMNLPWNSQRPRYAESVYDHPSSYSRREVSPMSFRSVSGLQSRNHSYYSRMGSQRSVYERSGSPMSVRTLDSNTTSVSAVDIATALKTMQYNKRDWQIIKEAYNKYRKIGVRERIEKRRRRFLKRSRYVSEEESGEQGSDSSLSAEECRSVRSYKTTGYRENTRFGCNSTRTDFTDFRKTMQECNIYRDCTDNFKQNTLRSMLPPGPRSVSEVSRYRPQCNVFQNKPQTNAVLQKGRLRNEVPLPSLRFCHSSLSVPGKNDSVSTQKDQCNGFQIASHRFNKNQSMVSVRIPDKQLSSYENDRMLNGRKGNNFTQQRRTDSEQEEIFSEITVMEKNTYHDNGYQNKRSIDEEDISVPVKKKSKLCPQKLNIKSKTPIHQKTVAKSNTKSNEFVFAKPQFTIRQSSNVKKQDMLRTKTANEKSSQPGENVNTRESQMTAANNSSSKLPPEILKSTNPQISKALKQRCTENIPNPQHPEEQLISKSAQPLDSIEPLSKHPTKDQCNPSDLTSMSTDVSMRPSFIKRKLFSQKVDMNDNRNSSSDNLEEVDTQDNIYSSIQREKNKARKLVTSQSCLSRDILGDESNLMDLIHKIVPPDRMNMTATNRSEILTNKLKTKQNDNKKWDISAVISSCNNTDNMSDTYTDEEIFKPDETIKSRKEVSNKRNDVHEKDIESETISDSKLMKKAVKSRKNIPSKIESKCKVVVTKLQPHNYKEENKLNDPITPHGTNGIKRTLENRVKSFWDTDIESDFDCHQTPSRNKYPINNVAKDTSHRQKRKDQVGIQQDIENIAPVPVPEVKTVASTKPKINKFSGTAEKHKDKGRKIKEAPKPIRSSDRKVEQPEIVQSKKPKLNLTLDIKSNDVTSTQKPKKQVALNKNGTLKVDSIQKIHNSTLRIRAPRTPKIKLCCSDPPKINQSLNDTSDTNNSRSLRSRTIDLSTSQVVETPLKKNVPKNNKAAKNNNTSRMNKNKDNSLSDLSFTLNTDKMKQATVTNKRVSRTRGSDVSFSLTTNKNLDITTSKRLNRSRISKNNEHPCNGETRPLKTDLSKLTKKSPLVKTVNSKTNIIKRRT